MAAGHIEMMTGFQCVENIENVPHRVAKAPVALASTIAAMIESYAKVEFACREMGLDLSSLWDARIDQASRMSRSRWKRSIKKAVQVGNEAVMQEAMDLILNGR